MTRKWDPNIEQYRDSGKFGGNDNVAAAGGMTALGGRKDDILAMADIASGLSAQDPIFEAAQAVAATGRPDPGVEFSAWEYREELNRWVQDNPAPADEEGRQSYDALNEIGMSLGASDDWDEDDLDHVRNTVAGLS